jgi:hypothetical protein
VIVAAESATLRDVPHFAGGIVPCDGIFTTWSYRAGAGRAEAFLLNPQPPTARTAHEWGAVAELVPTGSALSRARELAVLYLKVPEVTRRNTRVHFIYPLKERIVREVGYGLSLEGASAADLVKPVQAQSESSPRKENPHEEPFGGYNMVAFQQELMYGRTSGTDFGNPDIVRYAESFGCVGMRVNQSDELLPVLRKALETPGMVVVDIPTDYSKNVEIGEHIIPEAWD